MANQYTVVYTDLQKTKIAKGLCMERFCRNKRAKQNCRCYKHKHEYNKLTNPLGYWYQVHKSNARRRKIAHTLTLAQFKAFVSETDYLKLKGKTKLSLCIDRMDNNEGYHHWNIRAITLQKNSWKRKYVDYGNKDEEECPF